MTSASPTSITKFSPKSHWFITSFLTGMLMSGCAPEPSSADQGKFSKLSQTSSNSSEIHFPDKLSDPYEPINRGISVVNEKALFGVIRPTSRVYRAYAPAAARKSISNFSRNITYPGRLVNNMFQGRWKDAGDESLRFLANSTVGIGGLFDPATYWKIPKTDASFSQTFYKWGRRPKNFVMLPLLGPSDNLDFGGQIADRALEPLTYYQYSWYANGPIAINRLADQTEPIVQFIKTEPDPYVGMKYLWTYASKKQMPDLALHGPRDLPTLRSLNAASIAFDDPNFSIKGRKGSVRLSSTGKTVNYNYWFQKDHAPLVYIAPGTGGHRQSANALVIAENLYQNGYSVVTTVSTFHPEFMENGSTSPLPGYQGIDCQDLLVYLTEINQSLEKKHPGKFGKRALVGLSLGGYQTLYLAAHEKRMDPNLLRFDRYLAINPPVSLLSSNKQLDDYVKAPLQWPASKRQERVNNTLHKFAVFPYLPAEMHLNPPFDGVESKYLIGLTFRIMLRDAIFSSQYRHNMGIINTPLNKWRREAAYNEIINYSFNDYLNTFAYPYFKKNGISRANFDRESDLRSYQKDLRADPRVRVITNKDDIILNSKDVSWLKSTLGTSRLTLFPIGGHVGNIATPPVEKAVIKSLKGLK